MVVDEVVFLKKSDFENIDKKRVFLKITAVKNMVSYFDLNGPKPSSKEPQDPN